MGGGKQTHHLRWKDKHEQQARTVFRKRETFIQICVINSRLEAFLYVKTLVLVW